MNKVLTAKKDYHAACRNEKSTANQENNARADTAMSSDQVTLFCNFVLTQEFISRCESEKGLCASLLIYTLRHFSLTPHDMTSEIIQHMVESADVKASFIGG